MAARPIRPLPSLLLPCLLTAVLTAQGDPKFQLRAAFEPATAAPGDTVRLVLRATTEFGWHAYGALETTNIPVSLEPGDLQLGGLEPAGPAEIPPGEPKEVFGATTYPLPESFEVVQPVKVPAGVSGAITVEGRLGYQLCDATSCDRPNDAPFSATLQVAQGPAGATPAAQAPKPVTKPPLFLVPDEKLTATASFEPATARAGETARLVVRATVIEGWHAYGAKETTNTPVDLKPEDQELGPLEPVGAAIVPPGEPKQVFGVTSYALPQQFAVEQVVRVPASVEPGDYRVTGSLYYQVCDEASCDLPASAGYAAVLKVEAGPPRPEVFAGDSAAPAPPIDSPFAAGWIALILASIGGGLFALAMPCTYPMIPITFSFFTKQAERRDGKVLPLTIVYGLGIITMFVLVGVLLSAVIIDVVNHWLTNTIIAVVFFFFAFVLFGWVNLNPPQWMQRLAGKASATGGLLGVFFMGATLVITSFTCTAPIVGSLIANVAKLGTFRVGVGMAIFGLTMAIPFMLLSLAPNRVKAMPKSGEWMETLKVSLGFLELAAAFKFVSMVDFALGWQALPRELFLILWTAIFGLWAMYLFGILRKAGTVNEGVGAGRMATGMVVTLFAAYCFYGALGYRLDFYMTNFVPGYSADVVVSRGGGGGTPGVKKPLGEHVIVEDDAKRAVEVAKAEDKLLLYNFTGFN